MSREKEFLAYIDGFLTALSASSRSKEEIQESIHQLVKIVRGRGNSLRELEDNIKRVN
ncbi:hypothetical protein LCGC14_2399310 [marine sediment metagenome]|uniref:Uncharacterized protein n=1 Tax=marine sediment metagenome TaxID=412755 RepID=A0A0F9EQ81_9ZZZZ